MADHSCAEMRLLIQAELDGELPPEAAARVAAHLSTCAGCATLRRRLLGLDRRLRAELPYHAAPARLRAAASPAAAPRVVRLRLPRIWAMPIAGGALAAALVAFVLLPARPDPLTGDVVAGHIRALQPGHLTDVVSTDQHTVKPWFDGRLDYAPPVRDLAAQGFPLLGGRLDYLAGRPVAALVYGRAKHIIDLFVWPAPGAPDRAPITTQTDGYTTIHWIAGGMTFWAVSDVEAAQLATFSTLLRAP